MKKILVIFFLLILVGIALKGCIKCDVPDSYTVNNYQEYLKNISFPPINKNITINGIDYLQSQAPVGKFGGELVISTIGEGPKHLILVTVKMQRLLAWQE